jgi:hypothetical protein
MTNEAVLARMVDEKAIERIIHDYAYYLDMNQPEKMIELFVEDCEVSYAPNFGASGMEAYIKTLDGIGTFFKGTSHHVSGVVIDWVSTTEANVRAILMAIHRYTKERPDGILYGQYHDVVVKQDGKWKFKTRILKTTMTANYHVKASNPIGRADQS